jgi:hypothetical protein
MWTSERTRTQANGEPAAELGVVTLGGDPAGVNLGGERRWLRVYSPGGYSWRPSAGDRVLVLKAGAERESPCILGKAQDGGDLSAGEVRLTGTGMGCVKLLGDRVELSGELWVNGEKLEDYVTRLAKAAMAGLGG